MEIRAEKESDRAAVRVVNTSAFKTPDEANLVDALREEAEPIWIGVVLAGVGAVARMKGQASEGSPMQSASA